MLNLDATDRRRLVIAAALTTVALPAIWLFARGEPQRGTSAPNVAAAAGVAGPGLRTVTPPNADTDPFGTNGPIFVDGPTTPPKAAVVPIVVPANVLGQYVDGGATYKTNADPYATTCSATNAPFNYTLTVTNLDNGRTILGGCVNKTPKVFPKGIAIELTANQFLEIGQLSDAPIHVRISWTPASG